MVRTSATTRIDLSAITEDLKPLQDAVKNLGAPDKRWNYIYGVIAVLTALMIGSVYIYQTTEGVLFINASTQINGSLQVRDYVNATNFYGNGSGLTDVTATFDTTNIAFLNETAVFIETVITPLLNATNITKSGQEVATLVDLIRGNITVTSIVLVKNAAGATAYKGMAMKYSAYNAAINRYDVNFADNSYLEGHATCLMLQSTPIGQQGQCVVIGAIEEMDTSMFLDGDHLWLNDTPGTLASARPATAVCVQHLGIVLRSHPTLGVIYVFPDGRCTSAPNSINITGNVTASYFFGDGSGLYNVNETDPVWLAEKSGYLTAESDPIFSAWDYSDLLNKSVDPYVTVESDPKWTSNSSTVARIGTCTAGNVVMNTTITGVQCIADKDTTYINASFDLSQLVNTGNVAVGSHNLSQNDNYYHCFGNDCDAHIRFNGTSLIIKVN